MPLGWNLRRLFLAALAALCIFGFAFLYFSRDGAAQFLGAFLAALVAAGAVIGNAYYQARLSRERDDRIAAKRYLANLVRLIGFIDYAETRSGQVEHFLANAIASAAERSGHPVGSPVTIRASELKAIGVFDFNANWNDFLQIASELPLGLAQEIVGIIYATSHTYDSPLGRGSDPQDVIVDKTIVDLLSGNFTELSANLHAARAKLLAHRASLGC